VTISPGGRVVQFEPSNLDLYAGPENAIVRVMTQDGRVIRATRRAPDLGPPYKRTANVDGYRVETRPIPLNPFGTLYVQYARPQSEMEATLERVRFFLLFGVLGGTALALLAGMTIAQRAMAPVAALTATADRIRRTRDPSLEMPQPRADDEVAQLARTLSAMLQSLDAAQHETESALERQREFVADASHELRTPLTSVLANLELLADTLAGEQGEAAESALRSSKRMRRLVADLLLLARADTGRATAREPTDLSQVVVEAAGELGPVLGEHDLTIDAEEGVLVCGSRDELHRLALNLMDNAVKHTPPGTHITVRVHRDGDEAVLVVEDDGPGIPPDLRTKIFERFVRGDGDRGGSFGLGLSIVRAVATSHGGTVTVGDGPGGRGTRFEVRLPATQPAPLEAPEPALA